MAKWIEELKRFLALWPDQAARYFVDQWGMNPIFAVRCALLYAALHYAGLKPRITSGWRDPKKQAAMRAAWDRGERQGLRVRPADPSTSKHCLTAAGRPCSQAVDMPCDNDELAAQIGKALGLRAGFYFSQPDPGHFDAG